MIARCPECQTRYRIAEEKIGPNGARIRCSQCEAVFRIEAPQATMGTSVLVAEPDSDQAKVIAGYLGRWNIETTVVHDGAEALLFLHRERPTAAIVGARLTGLRGAELAELVRRTSELGSIKLIRVVPEDETAASHFEADHTLEPADLPDGLAPILERLGIGERPPTRRPKPRSESAAMPPPEPAKRPTPPPAAPPAPSASAAPSFEPAPQMDASEPPLVEEQPPAPAPVPAAAAPAPARKRRTRPPLSDDPEIAAAERLSRIIVSDIILYNDEKFEEGVRDGNVVEVLTAELDEAGTLFEQRIPEEIRAKRAFLVEELERRAEAKRS